MLKALSLVRFQLTLAYDDVVQRKHSSSYTLPVMFVAETAILKTDGFQAADRGSIPRIVFCDTVTAKTKTFWSHKPIVKAGVM